MKLSARTILPGKVTEITKGEAIANVVMECNGRRIVSSITVEAVTELGLEVGSDVSAVATFGL